MPSKPKFWCQSCAAYIDEACPKALHRSEQMKLVDRRWESYVPSRVFERKPDGSLQLAEGRTRRAAEHEAHASNPQATEYERLLKLLRDSGGYGADSERMAWAALQARSEPERHRQQLFDSLEHLLRSLEHPTAALPRFVPLDHATLTDAEEAIKRCRARGYEAHIDIASKPGGDDSSRIVISARTVRAVS
jgi:hypothetical protein